MVLSDVMQRGGNLAGGGALIPCLPKLLEGVLKLQVIVVPDPLRAVVRGIGTVLENLEMYEELLTENEGELSPQL